MSTTYQSFTEARTHFKEILDAAAQGQAPIVRRDGWGAAVVDAGRLRELLARTLPFQPEVVSEDGLFTVFLPDVPVAAEGSTLDEALDDFLLDLREYAMSWVERLRLAQNHAGNWPLVQFIQLSTDIQLREWLLEV